MQCGRVGSRPLSTTEGSQGHAPWEPSLHLRPTPSPSRRREGSVMPRQATSEASKGVHFLLELHVANECRVVVCIRQWGPCLVSDCRGHTLCLIAGGHALRPIAGGHAFRPIAGAVPASDCRGCALCRLPKAMSGRFPITRNHQHAFGSLQLWFASLGIRVEWEFRYVFSYV